MEEIRWNKSAIIWVWVHLTCRNHAVSMGSGWQAVTGRAVVHEDWQRWISCQLGERIRTERLARHVCLCFGNDPMTHWCFSQKQTSCFVALFTLLSLFACPSLLAFWNKLHLMSCLIFPVVWLFQPFPACRLTLQVSSSCLVLFSLAHSSIHLPCGTWEFEGISDCSSLFFFFS